MQTLSTILIVLSWLAVAGMIIGAGIAVYAIVRAHRQKSPWGWREIGEGLAQEEDKEG